MATTFNDRWSERRRPSAARPAHRASRVDYGFLLYFMLRSLGFVAVTLRGARSFYSPSRAAVSAATA